MSTTHYSPSNSATDTEFYIRGKTNQRGVAITCDVGGPPGAFAERARRLTHNSRRSVEALHYRQSFSDSELDPKNPHDIQRANDLGYLLAKMMHPNSDCLVVTHTDGRGGKVHNHILVINHNNETGKALSDFRTFHDRKAGNQRGLQPINDELMTQHGLSVIKRIDHTPKDWEQRREDFAVDSLDRVMGDRMSAALADPRSTDLNELVEVISEQNSQTSEDGQKVPHMRLHESVAKKGKHAGKPTWTLYIEDVRGETNRAERRTRTSALCVDFTPEGAQAYFDYHQQQAADKEQTNERRTRTVEAARRAAEAARKPGPDANTDLNTQRNRGSEQGDLKARPQPSVPDVVRESDGRGGREADWASSAVDHAGLRTHARQLADKREREKRVARDGAHAEHTRRRARRKAAQHIDLYPDVRDNEDREDDGLER